MSEGEEESKLRNATMNSLLLAEEHDLKSIAFPAISTGVFGFPMDKCAEIMLTVAVEYLKRPSNLQEVYFCLWGEESYTIFKNTLDKMV
jgi:O-acetyl-ADP-ribose deacetylase (regulator of RNase III)